MADSHLGRKHSRMGVDPKTQMNLMTLDAERQLETMVDIAINERVDFVVHSGDIFDRVNVSNTIIKGVLKNIKKLTSNDIPFFIIPGNHDRPFTRGIASPVDILDYLTNSYNIGKYDHKSINVNSSNVMIHGIAFQNADIFNRDYKKILKKLTEKLGDYNILLTHQSVEGMKNGYELTSSTEPYIVPSSIPTDFQYIALGHVHLRQSLKHPHDEDIIFHFPGSPLILDFRERNQKKAASIVTMTGKTTQIDEIELDVRPFIEEIIDVMGIKPSEIEERIRRSINKITNPEAFLGIRIEGSTDEANRKLLNPFYYKQYASNLAGFNIYHKNQWLSMNNLTLKDGDIWRHNPEHELRLAIEDYKELSDDNKKKILELGIEIIKQREGQL